MTKKSKKISSSLLSELKNQSLNSNMEIKTQSKVEKYPLAEQKTKLKKRSTPTGVSFYDSDLVLIRELQQFFFSKRKIDSSTSKMIRCALRLASSVLKDNEYMLLSIYQEVENEDIRRK